ncbi:MAG: hypothetical protein WB014_05160 [Methanosarcina sp.]
MGNVSFKKIMVATNGSVCSRLAANKGIRACQVEPRDGLRSLCGIHRLLFFYGCGL